jgi:hypothetical protein
MEGKLLKTENGWVVKYTITHPTEVVTEYNSELPLHPSIIEPITKYMRSPDEMDSFTINPPNVKFDIVDNCAKLIMK